MTVTVDRLRNFRLMSHEAPTDRLSVDMFAARLQTLESRLSNEIQTARVIEIDGKTFLKFGEPPSGLFHQQELGMRVTVADAADPPSDD